MALRAYRAIKRGDMPLGTLRRFLHLLDIGQVRKKNCNLIIVIIKILDLLLNVCAA